MRKAIKKVIAAFLMLTAVVAASSAVSAAIQPGTVSDEVISMQNKLIALGYLSSSASGSYNTATETAVRTFEAANGLTADGRADDAMLEKLGRVYEDAARVKVITESADIYAEAGADSVLTGTLRKDACYVVLDAKEVSGKIWYSFRYGMKTAWISCDEVEYIGEKDTVGYFASATVNVPSLTARSGAGTDNPKVTTLKKGTVVAISEIKEENGAVWYGYVINGKKLWINSEYVVRRHCVAEKSGAAVTVKTTRTTASTEAAATKATTTTTAAATTTTTTTTTKAATTTSKAPEEIEYTDSVFTHSDEYRLSKYYDALCRTERTGDLRTDIAAVALSQVGYHEGSSITDVSGKSSGSANYTEYGINYGTPNDYWCAMFVWWCARQANVQESIIPKTEWAKVITYGCDYASYKSGIQAQKGDLLFVENTGDGFEDHVALVVSVTSDTITTVEGNTSNQVKKRTYSRTDGKTDGGDAKILYVGYPDYEGANTDKDSYETECIVLSSAKAGYSAPDGQYKGDLAAGEYLLLNEGKVGDTVWYRVALGVSSRWVKKESGVSKKVLDKAPISSLDTTTAATTATAVTTTSTKATVQTENEAVSPTTPAARKVTAKVQFAKVNANSLNLRSGAGTSYAKIATAAKGSEYAVITTKTVSGQKWYNIIYKGQSVWASGAYLTVREVATEVDYVDVSSYITAEPRYLSRTAVITADADILYADADPASAPVAVLKKGITYTVCGDKGYKGTSWHKINADGIEGYISRYNLTLTNHYVQIPDRDFTAKTPVIYLSPSKQGANPYIIGNTSEKAEMEALGDIIFEKLKAYDCVVHLAPKTYSLEDRAIHAQSLGTDVYIAIHSNATGNSTVHYGPSAYYFPGCAQSKIYAESIVSSLNKVVPLGSNLTKQVMNGMSLAGGCGYAEVREPGRRGMIGVLVETDFHDYEPTAKWLMNEKEKAADAYVESLVNAFGLKLRETE